ncbi:hypothetical protein K2X14_00270 [Acetobacter sp. TBRC 12305]|uniref:Uncharacterized protein n=1 Tax=Acetobacter garciniae TaxID=2817435 RepID=A0A939KP74_9PROT|nr:hypothetical protein [Acetobacter garciniae]MBO1323589.1 hypothetical protein [Acetobacter garciniae]MBX0343278.1 hypothetical protein [Acetobacter garciniae]
MSQKQTFAPHQRKSPVATPDRLAVVQTASWELSAISTCLSAMGRELIHAPEAGRRLPDSTGNAVEWLAAEIERRCALIDEVLS